MKRSELLSRLESSMLLIGKGMHEEQLSFAGCSPAQNHVLIIIGLRGDIGTKQLAETLLVTSGAATQHVDALEKAGFVTRQISASDRRGVVIRLTESGQQAYHEIRAKKVQLLRKLFAELSDDELRTLVNLIEKVAIKFHKNKDGEL
jgi:DNA-binding MarR family transcriptional regulator